MPLTLYKFGPKWGIDDPSPFCLKLENYLKIANIAYQAPPFSPMVLQKAPKGKLPFIRLANGQTIGDSTHIINHLIAQGAHDPDAGLTTEQKAISLAFSRLLEENLYWVLLYSRWREPAGWPVIKKALFADLPIILRSVVSKFQQKKVWNSAKAHGMGRHTPDEIYAIGEKDMTALSDFLADKAYIFDTKQPTLLDITLSAYTINILNPPINNRLKSFTQSRSNLVAHCDRVHVFVAQSITLGDC